MERTEIPRATHEAVVDLDGKEYRLYGIEGDEPKQYFARETMRGMFGNGYLFNPKSHLRLQIPESLKSFLTAELVISDKILRKDGSGRLIDAYSVDKVVGIASAYTSAWNAGKLHQTQVHLMQKIAAWMVPWAAVGLKAWATEQLGMKNGKPHEETRQEAKETYEQQERDWLMIKTPTFEAKGREATVERIFNKFLAASEPRKREGSPGPGWEKTKGGWTKSMGEEDESQ